MRGNRQGHERPRSHDLHDDGVADVRMIRADKMNALDEAMFAA